MKETLKERAYHYIKEKILNCEYQPGAFLSEEMLREEVKASRTPIRDAISRLEQENLVRILPKKGIQVSGLSIREIQSVYESRLLLEPYAVLQYGGRIPQQRYLEFRKAFCAAGEASSGDASLYEADSAFHTAFVEASENTYLLALHDQISSQNRRIRILSGGGGGDRMARSMEEHCRIIEGCLAQDWEAASDRMREHLLHSRKAAFDVVLKNYDLEL